jgi:hypothetical protein
MERKLPVGKNKMNDLISAVKANIDSKELSIIIS